MSHDSTAAPEAAARKLSGRRRKEIVAVLLFSGGPIFESSIPLSVFGIDRQAGTTTVPARDIASRPCGVVSSSPPVVRSGPSSPPHTRRR